MQQPRSQPDGIRDATDPGQRCAVIASIGATVAADADRVGAAAGPAAVARRRAVLDDVDVVEVGRASGVEDRLVLPPSSPPHREHQADDPDGATGIRPRRDRLAG